MTTSGMGMVHKELPPGWKWVKLGEVCHVNPRRPSMDWKPHTRTTFVPMPSVDDQTGAITRPEERDYSAISKGYTYFEEDDVLFAKITPCMQNGKHAIATQLLNGFAFGSTEFHVLRPQEEIIPGWIHKFLRQPSILAKAKLRFRGAVGQQRVPKEFLGELPIPLPPLGEQKRIDGILNERMATVAKAKKAAQQRLEAAKALPTAYLRDMFEGEEAKTWPKNPLGNFCVDVRYGTSNKSQEEGVPVLRIPNVVNGHLDFDDLKNVPVTGSELTKLKALDGDVFFVRTNGSRGNVGRTCIFNHHRVIELGYANKDIVFASYLIRVRLNQTELMPEYLHYYLESHAARAEILSKCKTTAGQFNLNSVSIKALRIPLPSVERQKGIIAEFNEKFAGVALTEESIQQELDTIEAMPAALLRKGFSGEL